MDSLLLLSHLDAKGAAVVEVDLEAVVVPGAGPLNGVRSACWRY